MNIIICGAGKVGFNLARTLSIGHNVIVIDKNKDALLRLQESLDILPYFGDIKNPATYVEFEDLDIDLFIAVTDEDEANIISCLVVDDVLMVKRKFLRLKNSFYADSKLKNRLNIDELIFPIRLSSKSVLNFLNFPKVNNIKEFYYSNYKLISIFSKEDIVFEDFEGYIDLNIEKVVALERDKDLYISYKGDIKKGDLVYLFLKNESIEKICNIFDKSDVRLQNCVIFGADELGVEISKILIEHKKSVKLIENDIKLCQKADDILGGEVDIINSKYQDEKFFYEENLDKADLFISTYKDDEYNIIKSLEAKELGIKKIVAINNESEFYHLMHRLGIVALRGPKMSAYNSIVEAINNSKVIVEKYFCGGRGVVYLRKIFENSKLVGKVVVFPSFEESDFFILRDEKILYIDGIELRESDILVAVCSIDLSPKVKLWIYEL